LYRTKIPSKEVLLLNIVIFVVFEISFLDATIRVYVKLGLYERESSRRHNKPDPIYR